MQVTTTMSSNRLPAIQRLIVSLSLLTLLFSISVFSSRVLAEEWIYTVRPGDNLWNLSERHLTSMRFVKRLQALNRIKNPSAMRPGTQIRIPIAWTKQHLHKIHAQIISVHGDAFVRRKDASALISAEQGMQLFIGDEITSGDDSFVTVEFVDKSQLRVQDNSHIRVKHMEVLGDFGAVETLIELQEGRTENAVPPESEVDTRFRIKTPSAISSVRGTDFRVGILDEGKQASSEVLAGAVQVFGADKGVNVPAGFGAITTAGKPPEKPVTLLPPPDLSTTTTYYTNLPLVINLQPLKGAHGYRTQIAIDPDFQQMWAEFTTAQLPFRDGELPDGNYWLRVRGIDALGMEGEDAVIAFALNARPEPPFVTAPLPGAAVDVENQEFEWAKQSEAAHYALTISRTDDFSEVVFFDPAVKNNYLKLEQPLEPGHYFWRIFSVSTDEGAGPFSDTMPFRVPFPGPALEEAEINDEDMTFAWGAGAEGQRFHFQLARDKAFTNLLHDQQTTASQVTVPIPDGGSYYLRVKTIESDGFEGPWGTTQVIDVPRDTPYWLLLLLLPLLILI